MVKYSKANLGETNKSIFEVFLVWSRILTYFMIFLEIKIVPDILLSLKFVSKMVSGCYFYQNIRLMFFSAFGQVFFKISLFMEFCLAPHGHCTTSDS